MNQLAQRGGNGGAVAPSLTKEFNTYLMRLKPQMALQLPQHMKADRMCRLALSAFSANPALQDCSFQSIASSLMTAGALGLEPGVNGAGWLLPYKGTCTFVPGWKGLVDLVSRSGRATVWTGAVFEGDTFDYALGDRPFVHHKPGDESDPEKLTHVYAIGRVNGSDIPVIEVWPIRKVWKHRDKMNKVGKSHYSFKHPEMYARKIPLLQVLKYMPSSIEVANAIAASEAAESGKGVVIDGDFVTVTNGPDDNGSGDQPGQDGGPPFDVDDDGVIQNGQSGPKTNGGGAAATVEDVKPVMSAETFEAKSKDWSELVMSGRKSPADIIATAELKNRLTDAQKAAIKGWNTQNA